MVYKWPYLQDIKSSEMFPRPRSGDGPDGASIRRLRLAREYSAADIHAADTLGCESLRRSGGYGLLRVLGETGIETAALSDKNDWRNASGILFLALIGNHRQVFHESKNESR
jgi:hypothetical protein